MNATLDKQETTINKETRWIDTIPSGQWAVYKAVMQEADRRRIPFALGGAVALGTYSGRWRNTKDVDLYICPEHREAMVDAMGSVGLSDYFEKLPYDRNWIYRGYKDNTIVDAIWSMANYRTPVDDLWISCGPVIDCEGMQVRVLPAEELIWSKIYILQRERCDWSDILNVLHAVGPSLDWDHLIHRMGEDWRLLAGIISVFSWVDPVVAAELPASLWQKLRVARPGPVADSVPSARVRLIDSRPWFGPTDACDLNPVERR
jgi:hypothetical protein